MLATVPILLPLLVNLLIRSDSLLPVLMRMLQGMFLIFKSSTISPQTFCYITKADDQITG